MQYVPFDRAYLREQVICGRYNLVHLYAFVLVREQIGDDVPVCSDTLERFLVEPFPCLDQIVEPGRILLFEKSACVLIGVLVTHDLEARLLQVWDVSAEVG